MHTKIYNKIPKCYGIALFFPNPSIYLKKSFNNDYKNTMNQRMVLLFGKWQFCYFMYNYIKCIVISSYIKCYYYQGIKVILF